MRIVGGRWRGRALAVPDGRGTRPTTDRTRESVASMVLSAFDLDLDGVRVLDAFAGSGALGLEMLSRGALSCVFVERNRRAAEVVRKNVKAVGCAAHQARVQVGDVFSLAARGALAGGPFDLVLLDPPYATPAEDVSRLVADLAAAGQLAQGAVVLYERASEAGGLDLPCTTMLRSKGRSTTAVDLLRFEGLGSSEERGLARG